MGCTGWFTARVTTHAELDAALTTAGQHDGGCHIQVVLPRGDIPPSLPRAFLDRGYRTT